MGAALPRVNASPASPLQGVLEELPEQAIENHYVDPDTLLQLAQHSATNMPGVDEVEDLVPDSLTEIAVCLRGRNKVHGRKLLAAALCEQRDLPGPKFASVSRKQAREWRRALGETTAAIPARISEAIATHELGEDSPATEALFGPWGNPDPGQRDDICTLFTSTNPAMTAELWTSALSFADMSNADTISACALDGAAPDRINERRSRAVAG